jgi:hypothetical protein
MVYLQGIQQFFRDQKMKKSLCFLLLLATSFYLYAQDFQINIKIDGMGNNQLYIGEYLGSKQYILDTLSLDTQGKAVLSKSQVPGPGLYFFILPGNSYFDILLGNCNNLYISTNNADILGNMQVTGCHESTVYLEYQKELLALKHKIQEQQENEEANSTGEGKVKYKMNYEMTAIREKFIASEPAGLVAALLRLQRESSFGLEIRKANSAQEFRGQYSAMVHHYLDNIDFADPRLIHTPFLTDRITYYFDKLLDKQPDTIWKSINWIMSSTGSSIYCKDFWRQWLLEYYSNAVFQGSDRVFVNIAEQFFLKAGSLPYNKAMVDKLQQKVDKMKMMLWGSVPPDPGVSYPDGRILQLSDAHSAFTLLIFYELDCPSCRYSLTQARELIPRNSPDKLTICAIYMGEQREEWLKFVKENGPPWLHGFNPALRDRLTALYRIDYLPKIYLLDKEKKIIASGISIAEAQKIILHGSDPGDGH